MDAEQEMERKDKQPCQNTLTRLSSFAEIKHSNPLMALIKVKSVQSTNTEICMLTHFDPG